VLSSTPARLRGPHHGRRPIPRLKEALSCAGCGVVCGTTVGALSVGCWDMVSVAVGGQHCLDGALKSGTGSMTVKEARDDHDCN